MSMGILMVTAMGGAESCATLLAQQLGLSVEIAANRRAALTALRRGEFAVVVMEESMAASDPQSTDLIWENAGMAVPVQVNFGIAGCARLVREVRSALARREKERAAAMRAAVSVMESELKSTVTGLLLQSELALREPQISPQLQKKLKNLVELAGDLRERLRPAL